MKTKDLIKLLENNGWKLIRHGGNHDVYGNGNKIESVPRHKETDEMLAKSIIRKHGLK
ncbi:MAG: type II toxin-antitoxin system HicA family toxin [Clostridiales bacterium]|nr:type II toxin-antitoxin system HicA family toxin [Clostridiales bacterium]